MNASMSAAYLPFSSFFTLSISSILLFQYVSIIYFSSFPLFIITFIIASDNAEILAVVLSQLLFHVVFSQALRAFLRVDLSLKYFFKFSLFLSFAYFISSSFTENMSDFHPQVEYDWEGATPYNELTSVHSQVVSIEVGNNIN
jgi:hypothetical protein